MAPRRLSTDGPAARAPGTVPPRSAGVCEAFAGLRRSLTAAVLLAGAGAALLGAQPAAAQKSAGADASATLGLDETAAGASSILVISMERLLRETAAARSIQAQADAIRAAIQSELGARQDALRAEERELVGLRETLDPQTFAGRVAAFEEEVRALKRESQQRGSLLQKALFEATEELRRLLRPELVRIMQERRAVVMLDARDIVLNARALDVSDEAIERIDAATPRIEVVWPAAPQP